MTAIAITLIIPGIPMFSRLGGCLLMILRKEKRNSISVNLVLTPYEDRQVS